MSDSTLASSQQPINRYATLGRVEVTLESRQRVKLEATPSSAQHRAIVAPGPSDLLRAPIAVDTVPRRIQPTHWKEGALIGGLAGGIGLALVASDLCRYSDAGGSCTISVPAGFMLGGFIGGSLGALIGGQISKKEDPPGR